MSMSVPEKCASASLESALRPCLPGWFGAALTRRGPIWTVNPRNVDTRNRASYASTSPQCDYDRDGAWSKRS